VSGDVTANEDAGPPVGPLGGFKGTRVIQPEVSSPSVTHSSLDEFIHHLQPSASQRGEVSEPDSGTFGIFCRSYFSFKFTEKMGKGKGRWKKRRDPWF
jgi:hypothetical protein